MPDIHPTALVSDSARLAEDVTVGPYTIIDGPAVIGSGCCISAHAWITGRVAMGCENSIGYGVVIGSAPQDIGFDPDADTGVTIGDGNTIREYATIHRATAPGGATTIGNCNFIMVGAHLGHDVVLGDDSIIANNAMFAGHIVVGNKTFIGGGAGFHQGLRIGDFAFVQGNCAISKDVPPYCFAYGANCLGGLNVIGLRRAGFSREERQEIKSAYALLFRSDKNLSEALADAETREWGPHARKLFNAVEHPTKRGVITRLG